MLLTQLNPHFNLWLWGQVNSNGGELTMGKERAAAAEDEIHSWLVRTTAASNKLNLLVHPLHLCCPFPPQYLLLFSAPIPAAFFPAK